MNLRLAGLMLLLSGATGLVYEVIWSKALADVLGNSGQAHAIVLATFMGGLALGAWAFGGLADRTARPLALYGAIELFVGLYAVAFPAVQRTLTGLFLSLAPGLPESSRPYAKLALAALALLPPTVAMGGTMPAMLKQVVGDPTALRRSLSMLYALNSLGAALGAWFAGTVSLPAIGLAATARWAAAINVGLAIVSFLAARPVRGGVGGAVSESSSRVSRAGVWAALLGLVLSGFTSMLYETGWIRIVTLIVGGSTYAFTWIVCSFILGIALGSFWSSRRPEGDDVRRFGWLQVGVVVAVAATIPLYLGVPWLFLVAKSVLARSVEAFPVWQAVMFLCASLVMLAPTFLMGAAFPVGARVVALGHAQLGRRLGLVWAANTVGTVLGALVTGLWLMPAVGLERVFTVGLCLSGLGALAAIFAAPTRRLRLVALPVVLLSVLASLQVARGWGEVLAQVSPFRVDPSTLKLSTPMTWLRSYRAAFETNFVEDDTFATVFVGTARRPGGHRFLMVNGKPDASTNPHDQATQVLIGHLGLLLAPQTPRRVMVVGAGAGVTVGSALTHPIEQLDLVEISPAVLKAARLFDEVNGRALDDRRVSVMVDDARTALALSTTQYDVIISEPSNPWVSGISSLFTEEFFEIAERRLAPDGVLVQWIHTYEIDAELVRLVMRTLQRRFPEVTVWQGGASDLVLVASRRPGMASFEALRERLSRKAVQADLARVDVERVEGLLVRQRMTAEQVRAFAGEGPSNTDDHNRLEYGAPIAFWAHSDAQVPDARVGRRSGSGLLLERFLAERPIDPESAQALFLSAAWSTSASHPLQRTAAAEWRRVEPWSRQAAIALAESAAQQGDVGAASAFLPPTRDLASALAELELAVRDDQLRQGPWFRAPAFDQRPFGPFRGQHPDVEKWLKQVCERRRCGPTD